VTAAESHCERYVLQFRLSRNFVPLFKNLALWHIASGAYLSLPVSSWWRRGRSTATRQKHSREKERGANHSEGEKERSGMREDHSRELWASLRTLPSCQRSTTEMLVFDYNARYTAFIYSTADQQVVTRTMDQNSSAW